MVDLVSEEYKNLMNRLHDDLKSISTILSFIGVTSAAIVGWGFTSNNPIVFLAPFLILIPCSYLILSNMQEVLFMGAYISLNIEPNNQNIKWERFFYEFRKLREEKVRKKGTRFLFYKYAPSDSRAYFFILTGYNILYVGLFFASANNVNLSVYIIAIFLAVIQFLINIQILKVFTSENEGKYYKFFKEINERVNQDIII
jgi:hypothetical protein